MVKIATYTNIGGREENEDCVLMRDLPNERHILAVCDGLGGHGGGSTASRVAAEAICGGWNGTAEAGEMERLVKEAHRGVQQRQTRFVQMKSTVAALMLQGRHAVWAHAGDTRLYRFCNGALEFQTKDHSASQIAVVLGQITPDQIRFHEDRSRVTRALGQEGDIKVECGRMEMNKGDAYAYLLCTDGFWEYVLEEEMEGELRNSASPKEWLQRMLVYHKDRIPSDNDNNTAAAIFVEA